MNFYIVGCITLLSKVMATRMKTTVLRMSLQGHLNFVIKKISITSYVSKKWIPYFFFKVRKTVKIGICLSYIICFVSHVKQA